MCRRCGTHLPLDMREAALPTRAALHKRSVPTAPRAVSRPGPNDTLLPHNPVAPPPARGADTLVPKKTMPTAAKRGAAGAAVAAGVAGLVTLRRALRRR